MRLAVSLIGLVIALVLLAFILVSPASQLATQANTSTACALPPSPDGEIVTIDAENLNEQQVAHARLILGLAEQRELPQRAGVIAVATALQESSLRNIDYGDAAGPDSRGLFQQRPQFYPGVDVMDPTEATNAFLDRLIDVENWQNIPLTQAAQAVQISALPDGYQKWEPIAQQLADQYWQNAENPTTCVPVGQGSGCDTNADGEIDADDVVSNVNGIFITPSLAPNLTLLLKAAEQDNLNLSGWGCRSNIRQKELRRAHCGGNTNLSVEARDNRFAVYERPSGQCSPPTATPGSSQHEIGLAVDFTCNGGSISSRTSPCFQWLDANAERYGLYNLPSEPWHWSTTGR